MDSSFNYLMLNIWDHSRGLPDWIVNGSEWFSNPSSCWSWCDWINADSRSTSRLWSLAGSNDGVGKIISQWNIITRWLVVERCLEVWQASGSIEEIAPVSAVRKF